MRITQQNHYEEVIKTNSCYRPLEVVAVTVVALNNWLKQYG